MSDEIQQLHAIVHGRVQNVGYRAATTDAARRIGVTGWVKNLRDGPVEVVAEGTSEQLQRLLSFLQHGPAEGKVSNVDAEWGKASGAFRRFDVRF